jgi:lipoprotein-anchoring transpeptidase ErfK/SrfK
LHLHEHADGHADHGDAAADHACADADADVNAARSGASGGDRLPASDGLMLLANDGRGTRRGLGRVRRIRPKAAAGAIPAAAAAALVVVSLSGCAGSAGSPAPTANSATQQYIVPPVSVSAAQAAKLPQATTYATIPSAPTDPARFAVTNGLVVHPLAAQVVYAAPGKAPVAVLPATELGAPTWVPVVRTGAGWDQVLLPSRPDHITGWIYTAGAKLDTRHTSYLLRVNLAAHRLSVYNDGKLLGAWTVAIGAPGTPTPTGRTFLLALLAPPDPTYSPLIVPLGTHSNALSTYGGGPGTVGIHGWPDSSVFGQSVSNGCVRVPATALQLVSTIPLGSLVVIS